MSPSSNRWRPRRAGIINLYEYANQVFQFAGGRLLLRGHNTSGKTKALELLLPFCLDGDINPHKLDPFGGGQKDMKWNIIGCTGDEQRIGYVWLEFERLAESGAHERLTAGIGMRAHKALTDVTRWYFVARNRAVGEDLELTRAREPIAKAELAAALGDDGEVLASPRDYRARLNDLLFGFRGEAQYQTMLRLMRDLRRPHLSKTLDPRGVAQQLALGLPEIDEALMRQLAGGLEQLETLEHGLARLRDVRERVRRFHRQTYSTYVRAEIRERADGLRQAQTAFDNASEQLRAVRVALERERAQAQAAAAERDTAERQVAELDATERALLSSEAWSSVAEVEALREHADSQARAADAAREHALDARSAATTAAGELITARAAAEAQREQASLELDSALRLASLSGLERRWAPLAGQLRDHALAPEIWRDLVRDLTRDWRDVLHRHRGLLAARRAAAAAAERARDAVREAQAKLDETAERLASAEATVEEAVQAVSEAFWNWHSGVAQLTVGDELAEAALARLCNGREAGEAVIPAVSARRQQLADDRARAQTERDTAADDLRKVEAEIERLQAEGDDGPPAPFWSRSERERAGAPLWRLVDFGPEVGASEQGGLEAALESSGLLDAWVQPDGGLADPELADIVLRGGAPASGRSLRELLVPVVNQPVAEEVVERLLGAIGAGERDGEPWVAADGRFALGPLAGRGRKPTAEHIGAAAREARRAARIAALQASAATLGEQIAAYERRLAELRDAAGALEAELAALPRPDAVAAALEAARVLSALCAQAEREHEARALAAREAAEAEVAADAVWREHAASHGLPAGVDDDRLDALRQATSELSGAVGGVAAAWAQVAREYDNARHAAERQSELSEKADAAEKRAGIEQAKADRLRAEHTAREAALGATGEELRRRRKEVGEALGRAREAAESSASVARSAELAAARFEGDEENRRSEVDRARGLREKAAEAFASLVYTGLLGLVADEGLQVGDRGADWSVTRALELARSLPAKLLAVRASAGGQAVEVQKAVQLLDRELAESDMGAYAHRGGDGLLLVQVSEGGAEQSLAGMLDLLDGEIADREQVLSAEERRVFNEALVEEIAEHLRQRLYDVRVQLTRMNAVLRRSPTAAGKLVELEWVALEDEHGDRRATLSLLRQSVRGLDEAARMRLIAFLRARIEDARREHVTGSESEPMAATLMRAFDYRGWFEFVLYECSDSGRVRLTKQRHAVGSGGEQSVLIHLPLFAAAAALYGDSPAPRLVMLDEALSGIDDDTRERVLGATVLFDLDLVMTSHELWGTYRTVPQLAIYQLHRENGVFGVHAIPFLWDGAILRELEQDSLVV